MDHLLQCPDVKRQEWRLSLHCNVRKKMAKVHTDPGLMSVVLDGIMSVFEDEQMDPSSYGEQYQDIVKQQNLIGWNNLFKGRWTKE